MGYETIGFSQPFIGGIAFNLANASAAVTPANGAGPSASGMQWGIIVDTAGNGFANSSVNYDAYAPGVATAGFLSAGGSVTDDYYIPGTTTVDGASSGDFDVNAVAAGGGCILDAMQFSLSNGAAPGQKFALVWFSNNTSSSGSKYGFLTDSSFVLPPDGQPAVYFDSIFINNDPIRPASKTMGVVATPAQISVYNGNGTGGAIRTDNTGVFTFPAAAVGVPGSPQTFTIENTGGSTLTIQSITNAASGNPGDFVVSTTGMATSLAANATTTFTVTFSPSATGSRSAVVQIASSDTTTSLFRINVAGPGAATSGPQISVFDGSGIGGKQEASNTGTFGFSPILTSGSSSPQTFIIENTGTTNLAFSSPSVTVAGSNPGDFIVSTAGMATSLAPNATTSFTVTFEPTAVGTRTAQVQIASNDPNTNPFSINVSGTAVAALGPQLSVFAGNSTSGSALVDGNSFALPTTLSGSSSSVQTFTIENTGTTQLTNLQVAKSVPGDATFVVDTSTLATTLDVDTTTSFTVTFKPTSEGLKTNTLVISSDNAVNSPFHINVSGQTHTVGFATASQTQIEHATTVTVPVSLSSVQGFGTAFTVPVTYGGTALKTTNYNRVPATVGTSSTASLSFSATQTVANITLTLVDDKVVTTPNRTVIVTLGTPSNAGVGLGAISVFTLTIQDADTSPVISSVPANQIVKVGDSVTFTSGVSAGSAPLTYLWKKNNVAIAGAANTYYQLPHAAALADGGYYSFTATNYHASVTSTPVTQLAVVDTSSSTLRFNLLTTATMTVNAAGNGLTYKWQMGGTDLPTTGTKYAGVTTKTLSVKTLAGTDAGAYTCVVTLPGTSPLTQTSGTFTLQVPTVKPTAEAPAFPNCVVNNTYPSYQLPYDSTTEDQVPTTFTVSNLPPGLVCNATTGLITGKPTTVGTYSNIQVKLSNGVGPATISQGAITIYPFPTTCTGAYVGLMDRDATLNTSLGGRVDLTVAAAGSFTGSLKLGASSYALAGTMVTAAPTMGTPNPHPGITLTVPRTGLTSVVLTLDLDPTSNTLGGDIGVLGGNTTFAISGWRNIWHTTAPANPAVQAGSHAFELGPDVNSQGLVGVPQGYGYGTITVTTAGATTVAGHMADGSVITANTGSLGPNGEVVVYQMLYSNKGSVLGHVSIGTDSHHLITGSLDWYKSAVVVARDYGSFGPMTLEATGGLYVTSAPVIGLATTLTGVNNAQLVFAQGGLPGDSATNPNVQLRISSTNVATFPAIGLSNPGKITALTLTTSTTGGTFSGKFTLTDGALSRIVSFQGQLDSSQGKGFGYFLLPQLANPPTTTATTSPILSGSVELLPWP